MTAPEPARWAVCSTVKADARTILEFAAHHLEAGAHRVFLYLDAPCPAAMPFLRAHPRIRVVNCNAAYWQKRRQGRPEKHQVRQTVNATRCYRQQAHQADWLAHIDVDEFLWAERPVGEILAGLPKEAICARVRPLEPLTGDGTAFKAVPYGADRGEVLRRVYPRFGQWVKGGFFSHTNGKLFVRSGQEGLKLRIHNAYVEDLENPCQVELDEVDLCHLHARDREDWLAHYRYRLEKGAYREELSPNRPRSEGGITLPELLRRIEEESGETGLRGFYDELCSDTPDLRARLKAEGLLRIRHLRLDALRRKHFPDFG